MRESEVELGQVYTAKVTGRVVRVLVVTKLPVAVPHEKARYRVINLKTGRDLLVTAQRLRERVS